MKRLIDIEKDYLAGWHALTVVAGRGGEPSYLVREVDALLKGTESALLGVTGDYPELEALGDWIKYEFDRARQEIDLDASGRSANFGTSGTLLASFSVSSPKYVLASALLQAQRQQSVIEKKKADKALSNVRDTPVAKTRKAAETDDGLSTRFGFETDFGNVSLRIVPFLSPDSKKWRILVPGDRPLVPIGIYSYKVLKERKETSYSCGPGGGGTSPASCPLYLVPKACKFLHCWKEKCGEEECHD